MRALNTRLWALVIAAAFVLLWCASVGVTVASPPQEPVSEAAEAAAQIELSSGTQIIGILGWCLVALGFLGVALTVALGGKPKRKRRMVRVAGASRRPYKMARSIYTPPPARRYSRNIERRR